MHSSTAPLQLPRVMLLCGADLLATLAQPGVWVDPDVILRDHGIVCICRQGTDLGQLLEQPGSLLHKYR
jgi:nicotinamide mononucleotide adenylyltransferase